jgi:Uma2 family endonuclease
MTVAQAETTTDQRMVLEDVSWDFYERMLEEVGDGHVRLTYDQGRLEIMSPSNFHELVKQTITRLLFVYADETDTVVQSLGSTTFRRQDLEKGLEPDDCFYIEHAADIIGKRELDLTIDPPPDLAIEIDITPPGVKRQPIYAALGVPEVWRYDGRHLHFLHRQSDSGYAPAERSLAFPDLPLAKLNELIELGLKQGQTAAVRALRQWLSENSR